MSKWVEVVAYPYESYYDDKAGIRLRCEVFACWDNYEYSTADTTVRWDIGGKTSYATIEGGFNKDQQKEGKMSCGYATRDYTSTSTVYNMPSVTCRGKVESISSSWVSTTFAGGYFNKNFHCEHYLNGSDMDNQELVIRANNTQSTVSLSNKKWQILDVAGNELYSSTTFNTNISITNAIKDKLIPGCRWDSYTQKLRLYAVFKAYGTDSSNRTICSYSYIDSLFTLGKAPTATYSIYDSNSTTVALTGDNTKFVRYFSTLNASVSWTCYNGATLASSSIKYNINKVANNVSQITNITNISDTKVTFTAVDSRNLTNTITATPTLIPYVKLTCSFNPSMTMNGKVSFTAAGNYFNSSFGSQSNSLTVQYRYKKTGGTWGSWINLTPSYSGNTFSASTSLTLTDFQYRDTFVFQVRATDKLMAVTTPEYTTNASPVFDWSSNDFNFNVPVSVKGKKLYVETILYENSDTSEMKTISLSDDFTNYDYLEIYYSDERGYGERYQKISCIDGASTRNIMLDTISAYENYLYIRQGWFHLTGNTITYHQGSYSTIKNVAPYLNMTWDTAYIKIFKVVGLKEI